MVMPACRSNMPRKLKSTKYSFFSLSSSRKEHHCRSQRWTRDILLSIEFPLLDSYNTLATSKLPIPSKLKSLPSVLSPVFRFLCVYLILIAEIGFDKGQMQVIGRATRSCQETLKLAILQHQHGRRTAEREKAFSCLGCVTTTSNPTMELKGLENTTVAQVLMTKGEEKSGSWLWCRSNDTVYDAAKHMAENNIGSLVVLKPGEPKHIAGIFTERDYMRKIIAQGRCSKNTRVGEIMTDERKLVTVSSDTNILRAMQLLTEYQIRHVPVIDGKIVGMISIVDIVRAVVEQQNGEVKRLIEFIKGDYN